MGWDPEQKPSVAVYIPKAERENPEELRRNPAKTCDTDQSPKRQRISRIAEAKKRIKLLNRTREQRREDRRLMKQRLKFQKKKAKFRYSSRVVSDLRSTELVLSDQQKFL